MALQNYIHVETVMEYMSGHGNPPNPPPVTQHPVVIKERRIPYKFGGEDRELLVLDIGIDVAIYFRAVCGDIKRWKYEPDKTEVDTLNPGEDDRKRAMERAAWSRGSLSNLQFW